jgi:LmbE family N-acetylglucosaminyl deacetylase
VLGPALRLSRGAILRLAPDVTAITARRSALVLAPHPDDETLACAGVIMQKLAAGSRVTVVVVADGSRSHPGMPARLGQLRHAEEIEAMRRLGLPEDSLRQLGYPDQSLTGHEDELVGVVESLVKELSPDEIYVTGIFEPHPDHSALGRATRRAVARRAAEHGGAGLVVMEYPIWLWSQLWHGIPVPLSTRLSMARSAMSVLGLARRGAVVRLDDLATQKAFALQAHESQLRRPEGVPASTPWWGLPSELLAAAADPVELFLPWRPRRRGSSHA